MTLSMGAEPRDRPCPIPYGNSTNSELTGSAESLSAAAAHCTYSTGIVMSPCTQNRGDEARFHGIPPLGAAPSGLGKLPI